MVSGQRNGDGLGVIGNCHLDEAHPVYYLLQFVEVALTTIATRIPNYISGPLVVISGILLLLWGQTRPWDRFMMP